MFLVFGLYVEEMVCHTLKTWSITLLWPFVGQSLCMQLKSYFKLKLLVLCLPPIKNSRMVGPASIFEKQVIVNPPSKLSVFNYNKNFCLDQLCFGKPQKKFPIISTSLDILWVKD